MEPKVVRSVEKLYEDRIKLQNPLIPLLMLSICSDAQAKSEKIKAATYLLTEKESCKEYLQKMGICLELLDLTIPKTNTRSLTEIILMGKKENIFVNENLADYKKITEVASAIDALAAIIIKNVRESNYFSFVTLKTNYSTRLVNQF